MEQVRLSDLGKIFVDEDSKGSVLRPRVSSRGYLLVCDDEAVRDWGLGSNGTKNQRKL